MASAAWPIDFVAMSIDGEYVPSSWDWVAKQVDLYESSGGTKGVTMRGVPCVVITMRGRRSGKVRKAAVMRIEHDGTYADVTVQDGPQVHDARARVVEADEKPEWWARAVEVWPDYDQYQRKTDRPIPVVLLEPRPG